MSTSTSSEAAELHRRLITARAPPSALLDGMDRLLHLDAAATCYLAPSADGIESVRSAAGAAADALPWLHAGLAEPVAAALTSARRYRRLIETEALVLPPDIGEGYLVVGAEPLSAGRDDETIQDPGLVQDPGLMLIWFHRRDGGSWPAGANTKDTYRELDRWLMALGHDLKNPLNLALLNAEILARRADLRHHAAVLRATEAIRGAILVQAAIINDLLELSRAHAGLITLRLVPADLRRSLQAIGAMLHDAQADVAHDEASACGRPATVLADPVRLDRIIHSIAAHALRTLPGSITIELVQVDSGFEQLTVRCTHVRAKLGPWRQLFEGIAVHEDMPVAAGQRVELALIRQFVRLHQGELEVSTDEQAASATIVLRLPALT